MSRIPDDMRPRVGGSTVALDLVSAPRANLDELGRLLAEATPGPWETPESIHGDPYITEVGRGILRGGCVAVADTRDDYGRSNAALIVGAVNALPALLAEVADLRETVARVEALPQPSERPWCRDCGPGYRLGDEGCRHDNHEAIEGETGICRTCALPIWWEKGTIGHQEVVGWSDRIERGGDSVVCFKAVGYRHVPMGAREEAIYRAGFRAALGGAQ